MKNNNTVVNDPEPLPGKQEVKTQFIEMRAKGHSIRSIARQFNLSPTTLVNWQSEFDAEIARLKSIELECLYEQYHLLKEHRVTALGEQLNTIKTALTGRNLSDVATEKLLDLQLRYMDEIRKELVDLKVISDSDIKNLKNKYGTKLDSSQILIELFHAFLRFKLGLVDTNQASREMSLLKEMLKAEDQVELQAKLDRLEGLLAGRGGN
jgi:transposase-like protein